ncbi:hypothetical protein JCM16303_004620 [Sporobolomyces ruberrimus]
MAPRPRCPVCRSKKWHRDALSGSIVCEEGHLLAGYVQESTEAEYASQHVLQTRRERKNKGKKERPPSNDYFHGDRSTFLVWQCMQLILREQLRILIDELGWPVELEAVTRDLFALLVASSRVPCAPFDYEQGVEQAGSYSGPRAGDRYTKRGRTNYGPRGATTSKSHEESDASDHDDRREDGERSGRATGNARNRQGERDSSDGSGTDSSEGESSPSSYFSDADDERPRLRRQGRRQGSSSPGGPPAQPSSVHVPEVIGPKSYGYPSSKARPPLHTFSQQPSDDPRTQPRMDYLLYILYLACVSLRLPVFLSDIFHLAETYQIPFLDASAHLPNEMQLHLSPSNRRFLSPLTLPSLTPAATSTQDRTSSQAWLARLVNLFREDWDVDFPEINLPLISARLCWTLALPPIANILAVRLLAILPQPITFHLPTHLSNNVRRSLSPRNAALAGSSRREKGLPPEFSWSAKLNEARQDWRMMLPELKVASVLVVVVKMFPFDTLLEEHARELPNLHNWLQAVQAIAELEKPSDPSRLWAGTPAEMMEEDVDAYLDFFEERIVSETKGPKRMQELGRFYPSKNARKASREPVGPESYHSRVDAMIATLYSLSFSPSRPISTAPPTRYPAHLSSGLDGFLPLLLSKLLVIVASHILPIPTSLPLGLQGTAPTLAQTSATYFLPQITLVERLLAIRSVPLQQEAAAEARDDERRLWLETKQLAQEFVRDQWRTEKSRRREVDRDAASARRSKFERKREQRARKTEHQNRKGRLQATETCLDPSEGEPGAVLGQEGETGNFKSKSVVGSSDEDEEEVANETDSGSSGEGPSEADCHSLTERSDALEEDGG